MISSPGRRFEYIEAASCHQPGRCLPIVRILMRERLSIYFACIRLSNKSLRPYRYKDFGSLVSLGKFSTVGNMMGGLIGKNLMIEGYFAKIMYLSLYKLHELAIHGFIKTSLYTFSRMITKQTNPTVKLH